MEEFSRERYETAPTLKAHDFIYLFLFYTSGIIVFTYQSDFFKRVLKLHALLIEYHFPSTLREKEWFI